MARIRQITTATEAELGQLAELLIDCVAGGASVSFMHPLSLDRALAFWRDVMASPGRKVLVADDAAGIVGTVQLVLDQPENQPHRGDIAKMLVHRRGRRSGIGAALLQAAEAAARAAGKTLLVLDTASGEASRLYQRAGWTLAGVIPGYALLPQGGLCDTAIYYRRLL